MIQRVQIGAAWSQRTLALRHGSQACGWPLGRLRGSAVIVTGSLQAADLGDPPRLINLLAEDDVAVVQETAEPA